MHHFVGADNSCISWGHAQYGELGYGPMGQKYVLLHFEMPVLSSCLHLKRYLIPASAV